MKTQKELVAQEIFSMVPTKVQGFIKQFPWITKLVDGPIRQVYVCGLEPDMLHYSCIVRDSNHSHERLYLLDKNGEIVTLETETIKLRPRRYGFWGGRLVPIKKVQRFYGIVHPSLGFFDIPIKNLWEAIERLGEKANEIHFVVSYFSYTGAVILYKTGKSVPLRQWINNAIEAEAAIFGEIVAQL